ncbi:MAG: hypothetical protein RMJ03_02165 [Nitrososphaerota archaeon]|nr:hypothetical protein [Nitrososphaerota archaeon]
MNKKLMAVNALVIMLVLMAFPQLISPQVYAVDVKIASISPQTKIGRVGETVTLIGTINTTNGEYRVWFGSVLVKSDFASRNNVNCTFTVPALPNGNYTIVLQDVAANVNTTSWFYIQPNYIVNVDIPPYPRQFQEGETAIKISISVTGGKANTVYTANITVKTPANETYWKIVRLSNTTNTGTGNASLLYPEDFGRNANTNYTGAYMVYFNRTLASGTFIIGLTDSVEYHRGDTVKIKAVDYSSLKGTNVTVTIKFENRIIDRFNCTVRGDFIEANWTVPNNALIGNYSISITPKPGSKKVSDIQAFAVPGFETKIAPRSLANENVANVLINIYDHEAGKTFNVTSSANGIANIRLERGTHTFTAYFKKVKVGEASINIPYVHEELNLICQLTNLNIKVVSEQGMAVQIPFVSLNLTITYTTNLDGGKIEKETMISQTDIEGSARFRSLLLNASYKVAALRYGKIFNLNNDTISRLEPKAWNNITILCPVKPLKVKVIDVNNAPIPNVLVEIQEVMGGPHYASQTNPEGDASFNCVLGVYTVKISKRFLLNATTVELFEEKTITIQCSLYNLPIYVKVVDYFGQPVPNANVTLEREGVYLSSKLTGVNGIAEFTEIGGTLTIKVYLADQNQPIHSFTCSVVAARDETNPIVIKLAKHVVFAGFLVETDWFATFILIVAALVLFAVLELARRKQTSKS